MSEELPVPHELAHPLAALAHLVLREETVDATLQLVVSLAQSSMARIDGASVSLVRTDQFETSNATSDEVRAVDELQYRSGRGPCVDAILQSRRYNVVLTHERDTWPDFTAAALGAGYASMLSTPLQPRDRTLGALNLYSRRLDPFGDAEVEQAEVFVEHASAVLDNAIALTVAERTNEQLQEALATREVIGQAQGILVARQGCTIDEAFVLLREASQRSNRRLRDIARELVEREQPQGRRS